MKNVNPFVNGRNIPHQTIGGVRKRKKREAIYIDDLRYGAVTTSKEEIDLCLSCPYQECVEKCKRLREYRNKKKNSGDE